MKSTGIAGTRLSRLVVATVIALTVTGAARTAAADFYSDIALRIFLGFRAFNDDSALGNRPPDGTSISHGPMLGVRGFYDVTRWFGVEAELPASMTNSVDDLALSLIHI